MAPFGFAQGRLMKPCPASGKSKPHPCIAQIVGWRIDSRFEGHAARVRLYDFGHGGRDDFSVGFCGEA
jgi:hypothetical protein